MTKKDLNWRLKKLPTAGEVAALVEQKVLTKDEAREILISKDDTPKTVKKLQEEIVFLRGLVDKRIEVDTSPRIIQRYYRSFNPVYDDWYFRYSGIIRPNIAYSTAVSGSSSIDLAGAQAGNIVNAKTSDVSTTAAVGPTFSSLN